MKERVAQPDDVPLDDQGRLTEEIPCRRCGHALRGLPLDGRCPECATPVGRSVRGNLLRYAEPVWVRGLASGMIWLMASLVAIIGLGVTVTMAGLSGVDIAELFARTLALIGAWKLTTPDPGEPDPKHAWMGKAVRGGYAAGLFATVCSAGAEAATSQVVEWSFMGFVVVGEIILTLAQLLIFLVLRRLALRIPDPDLAQSTKTCMWGFIIAYSIVVLIGATAAISGLATGALTAKTPDAIARLIGLVAGLGVFGCAAVIMMAIFAIWWIVLLFRYRTALHWSATNAEQSWAAADAESGE